MKKQLRNAILLVAGCIELSSCNRDPKPEFISIASQSLRDAVDLKAGSYYIFRDSASGNLDSFYASSNSTKTVAHWGYDNTDNEQIYYDLYGPSSSPNSHIGITTNRSWVGVAFSGDQSISGLVMFDPFQVGMNVHWVGDEGTYATAVNYYHTLTVEGFQHQDVYELESYDTNAPTQRMRTWFSSKTGLIKYRYEVAGFKAAATLVRFDVE